MSFTVVIVGRPNVGKSTLFNRLAGRRQALVHDTPGVTRDRREGQAQLADLRFTVVDTAGLEDSRDESLSARTRAQTEEALKQADVALFLIDARAGVTPVDRHFSDWLRRRGVRVVLCANKSEGAAGEPGRLEAYALGLGEPLAISAEHGEGLADLYDALRPLIPEAAPPELEEAETGPLRLAIVGRPNVGKSTLVNRLLGEDRVVTGPEPGITRDAVTIPWSYQGTTVHLVDTAGLRRKSRVTEKLEVMSTADSLRTIRQAHVAILVIDAEELLSAQDLAIAELAVEEGRALVIAANKWDAVKDRSVALKDIRERVFTSLAQARGVPVISISGRTGQGVDRLMTAVLKAYETWNRRISTSKLNRWLEQTTENHSPPLAGRSRIRLRYMTQTKARPPTFVMFANKTKGLPESYIRYLANSLREAFDLPGVPIRIQLRASKNPFVKDDD